MKKYALKSLVGGLVYTIIFCGLIIKEKRLSEDRWIFAFSVLWAATSFSLYILFSAFKYHLSLENKGWQRILFILYILLLPLGLYIGYKVYDDYFYEISDHVMVTSMSAAVTYIAIIGLYFLLFFLFKWVENGFTENDHNA